MQSLAFCVRLDEKPFYWKEQLWALNFFMEEITYVITGNLFQEYYLTVYKTIPFYFRNSHLHMKRALFIDAFDWCAFLFQEYPLFSILHMPENLLSFWHYLQWYFKTILCLNYQ